MVELVELIEPWLRGHIGLIFNPIFKNIDYKLK
jgi:hypothetical protein